ncbi:IclR family transcriptional regulator [Halocatena marina]|uniref:IclR family transcriptional regulator n=1 Tax=Halocatena marina TaxID=2934937 RepID=UPI00200C55D7|nr:IclR family transcriptional regulator [Halocatena marina]
MVDGSENSSSRTLKTVTRAFDVIHALEELDGARVTELATHLDMSKSAVYNYLTTLREKKFVIQEGNTYSLSLRFLLLGEYVRNQNKLYEIGKPEIENLADETGEYAHLATEQHGLSVNLYKVRGEKAVGSNYQTNKLQKPDYLHFSATGKSILAYLPPGRVDTIVDRYGLTGKTKNTITDRETLFEELDQIQERGYAYNDEEEIEGLKAIGAPVLDRDGRVLGSLSISGPTNRMNETEYHNMVVEKVTNAANVIEVNINMSEDETDLPKFI